MERKSALFSLMLLLSSLYLVAQEISPYMGGEVELVTASNGAITRAEVLETSSEIIENSDQDSSRKQEIIRRKR